MKSGTELLLQVKCEMVEIKKEEIASSIYTRSSLLFLAAFAQIGY